MADDSSCDAEGENMIDPDPDTTSLPTASFKRHLPKLPRRSRRILKQKLTKTFMSMARSLPACQNMTTHEANRTIANITHSCEIDHKETSLLDNLQKIRYAFQTEVETVSGKSATDFLPEPAHWKHILRMPERLQKFWLASLRVELVLLIKQMNTFKKETPGPHDPIIPTTTKFRTKLKADGTVDKLKTRCCLRGDQQAQYSDYDTWCPIASFRELRLFLAWAARKKCRVYQLDFIGAFLQAKARNRVFTMLPAEWKEFFPDLAEWFGVPLLLLKSLYGQTDSSKNWDLDQSEWLINDFGFKRCVGALSIYHYQKDDTFMYLINAVDDQLYFTNNENLRKEFEARLQKRFDVELMGQAHWYLQARITQEANHSIVLDQARYMALISSRFLPQYPTTNITNEDKAKYSSPLPASFVPSKKKQSKNFLEAKELEKEYGFQYSSAIGMLIYLMNTAMTLQYAIRKLAKFNTLPGKDHYKALIHLLHHVRTHRTDFGLKFYSPDDHPPIHALVKQVQPNFNPDEYPLLLFSDSSWQDCIDSSRSTGAYVAYIYGSFVDGASFVPVPVALSSAEAEYNAAAFAITATIHLKQVFNSLLGNHPDAPLTFLTFVDSTSAIAMMSNEKESKYTRHIERRVHFVRQAKAQGTFIPVKIPGEQNPADIGTKSLTGSVIMSHIPVIHVSVPP